MMSMVYGMMFVAITLVFKQLGWYSFSRSGEGVWNKSRTENRQIFMPCF
jgi:hypothetical protein